MIFYYINNNVLHNICNYQYLGFYSCDHQLQSNTLNYSYLKNYNNTNNDRKI